MTKTITDGANLTALAVEYLVVQTNIRQSRLEVKRRERELTRSYEELMGAKAALSKLEIQNGELWQHLSVDEQEFIDRYDETGSVVTPTKEPTLVVVA